VQLQKKLIKSNVEFNQATLLLWIKRTATMPTCPSWGKLHKEQNMS